MRLRACCGNERLTCVYVLGRRRMSEVGKAVGSVQACAPDDAFRASGVRKRASRDARTSSDVRWYVARVHEGREESCARDFGRAVPGEILRECFVPRVRLLQKRQGAWVEVERLLYPGYVFALTGDPRALDARLGGLSAAAYLVGRQGRAYVPLAAAEQAWFQAVLDEERVLRPSEGAIEGGQLRVKSGPLRGFERRVRKINRHKALAYVEVDMPEGPALLRAALAVTSRT